MSLTDGLLSPGRRIPAEIYSSCDQMRDAEATLTPVVPRGDPEVHWRLAEVLASHVRFAEANRTWRLRSTFDKILDRHLLAFADHDAGFYAGSGDDIHRALDLARIKVANRPTRRAVEQDRHSRQSRPDGLTEAPRTRPREIA